MGGKRKKIRWQVLLPPWIAVMVLLLLNLADYDSFVAVMDGTIGWILEKFAWMLDTVSLAALVLVTIAYFSPIRNVRIGGSRARPVIKYTNYVWIVLCTIMGAGLMLWACAEPVTHIHNPPVNVTQGPLSGEAILWAMENIFLEWTFTPMAIYDIVGILFTFAFYNMRGPFSIGSMLIPVLGKRVTDRWLTVLDSVCLFCICLGMASTLGSGILLPGHRRRGAGDRRRCGGGYMELGYLWGCDHHMFYSVCLQRPEKGHETSIYIKFMVLPDHRDLYLPGRSYLLHIKSFYREFWGVYQRLF